MRCSFVCSSVRLKVHLNDYLVSLHKIFWLKIILSVPKSRLFHIKCIEEYVRTIEVFCKAESLNSNDSFVYLGQYKTYIWYGKVNINLVFLIILDYTSYQVTLLLIELHLL